MPQVNKHKQPHKHVRYLPGSKFSFCSLVPDTKMFDVADIPIERQAMPGGYYYGISNTNSDDMNVCPICVLEICRAMAKGEL